MAATLVEIAEELVVVVGSDGAVLLTRLGAAQHGAGHATALDHADQVVRRHGEQHYDQQDLQHETKRRAPMVKSDRTLVRRLEW